MPLGMKPRAMTTARTIGRTTIRPPRQRRRELVEQLVSTIGDLDLHRRVKRTLIKTLGRVMRRVERGREGAAREVLSRLLNQIDAAGPVLRWILRRRPGSGLPLWRSSTPSTFHDSDDDLCQAEWVFDIFVGAFISLW